MRVRFEERGRKRNKWEEGRRSLVVCRCVVDLATRGGEGEEGGREQGKYTKKG